MGGPRRRLTGRVLAGALVVLGAVGCSTTRSSSSAVELPAPTVSASPPVVVGAGDAGVVAAPPLAIGDRLVDPWTAATVGKLAVHASAQAVPVRDGSAAWRVDSVLFGATGTAVGTTEPLRVEAGAVVREEPRGAVRWRTALAGARSVRRPDAVIASSMAVVAVDDVLHAFDDVTGKPTWTARGPADRLATDGSALFVTDCRSGKVPGRALRALRPSDGKELWKSALEDEMDPDAIEVGPRQLVVRDASHRATIVFDHAGHELARLHEAIWSISFQPTGVLLFGDKRVVLLDDGGAVRWTHPALASTFVAGTDVVATSAGLLLGNYGAISDSGVDLVLVDPATGATRWETRIRGLGVGHSEYFHTAYLDVRGGKVFVVSQGSAGAFFERVDLATGKREQRCDPATATCAAP